MDNRLDFELVLRGIATGRERAKEYIKAGKVLVNGKSVTKASATVSDSDDITIIGETLKYVGRGGLKLEGAINSFELKFDGLVCCDLGASTGGFTDCMLQNGANKVFAVDVGHGQLVEKLREDTRVVNIEGMNVKDLTAEFLGGYVDFVASDLSFISCRYAADAALRILMDDGFAVILIKPQFEVGKSRLSKTGIVRDKKDHINCLESLSLYFNSIGLKLKNLTASPIKGGDGNIEYLALLVKSDSFTAKSFDFKRIVNDSFEKHKEKE